MLEGIDSRWGEENVKEIYEVSFLYVESVVFGTAARVVATTDIIPTLTVSGIWTDIWTAREKWDTNDVQAHVISLDWHMISNHCGYWASNIPEGNHLLQDTYSCWDYEKWWPLVCWLLMMVMPLTSEDMLFTHFLGDRCLAPFYGTYRFAIYQPMSDCYLNLSRR